MEKDYSNEISPTRFCECKSKNGKDLDPDSHCDYLYRAHLFYWGNGSFKNNKRLNLKIDGHKLKWNYKGNDYFLSSDCLINCHSKTKCKIFFDDLDPSYLKKYQRFGRFISAHIIFPCIQINKRMTINAYRGCHLGDRLDLTLEAIKKYYDGEKEPYRMKETILQNKTFFDFFESFNDYIHYFLLDDALDSNGNIIKIIPYDDLNNAKVFPSNKDEFLLFYDYYQTFSFNRSKRMKDYLINYY